MHVGLKMLSLKEYTVNPVIKVLIVNDFIIWSGVNLISPILPLFVADRVDGKAVEIVAISSAIYLIVQSLIELPIARMEDKWKGEKDELWIRVGGMVLASIMLMLYPMVTQAWHIYLLEAVSAFGRGIAAPSWYSLFSKYLDKNKEGITWGIEDTVLNIGMAATAALGGFMAYEFGFAVLFYIAGGLSLIGAFIPLVAYDKIRKR